MFPSAWGVVRDGKVELTEDLALVEGSRVLVTALPKEDDVQFWQQVAESSLAAVWDNPQDDVYAQLLEK